MIAATANNQTVNTVKRDSDVNRLSKLQKQVMVALWREQRLREQPDGRSVRRNGRRGNWYGEFGGDGCRPCIGWQWQIVYDNPPTRSECAALSRALSRLESRGLISRGNANTGKRRCTSLDITDCGRVVASRLAGDDDPYPTEADYLKAVTPTGPTLEEHEASIRRLTT